VQRGEGIIRYFGMRAGDDREEGGFARIGLADEADIRDELEAQPDPALLARPAFIGTARGAVGGGFVFGVAEAAISAAQEGDGFARRVEIRQESFPVVVEDLRAIGTLMRSVGAAAPVRSAPEPLPPFFARKCWE